MRNCELKNDSFSIHFTILLDNDSGIDSRKRPKTVKESELRFFWNRNRHSPNLDRCLSLSHVCKSLTTRVVLLSEHQPSSEQPVPLGQHVRRSGQQTASASGQHPHSNSDPLGVNSIENIFGLRFCLRFHFDSETCLN